MFRQLVTQRQDRPLEELGFVLAGGVARSVGLVGNLGCCIKCAEKSVDVEIV